MQMPRNGVPPRHGVGHHGVEPAGAQRLGAAPEGAHAGKDHSVRTGGVVGVGHEARPRPEVHERLVRGSQVADPVVEDGDPAGHRHPWRASPSVPLVEGTPAALHAHGVAEAARHALERCLEHVVRVLAGHEAHVHGDPRRGDQRAPELLGQLGVEGRRAEPGGVGPEADVVGQVGPARDVEGDLDERLVERQRDGGEAPDAGLVPERLGQGLAQHDADVLDGVVRVDVEIAGGAGRRGRNPRGVPAATACGRRTGAPSRPGPSPPRRARAPLRWPSRPSCAAVRLVGASPWVGPGYAPVAPVPTSGPGAARRGPLTVDVEAFCS